MGKKKNYRIWKSAAAILAVLFMAAGIYLRQEKESHKVFSIDMAVDFGPGGKPAYAQPIDIESGTTAKEAVSQVFPVLSGKGCCSLREVIEIGGVRIDPAKNRWWICTLNGSKNFSPQKKKLRAGDKVEWKYIEDAQ